MDLNLSLRLPPPPKMDKGKRAIPSESSTASKKARPSGDDATEPVLFYTTKGPWGFMSNFSRHAVVIDGIKYPTSEHYYQCQKTSSSAFRERIRLAAKPMDAARLGRSKECQKIPDWDDKKISVMEKVLRAKLKQNPELLTALLKSGDRPLIEASSIDPFWGWGAKKDGHNHLGKLWMKLREEHKQAVSV